MSSAIKVKFGFFALRAGPSSASITESNKFFRRDKNPQNFSSDFGPFFLVPQLGFPYLDRPEE